MKKIKRFLAAMMVIAAVLITPVTAHAQEVPEYIPIYVQFAIDYQYIDKVNIMWSPVRPIITIAEGYESYAENLQLPPEYIAASVQKLFPNGASWGMEYFYTTMSDVTGKELWIPKTVQGCEAFAYMLTDAIFGDVPMEYYNYYNGLASGNFQICNYDIICFETAIGTQHCGVVIGADPTTNTVYIAEGNYGGVVNWGRAIKLDGSDGNHLGLVIRRECVIP